MQQRIRWPRPRVNPAVVIADDFSSPAFIAHAASTAALGLVTLLVLVRVSRLLETTTSLIGRVEDEFFYQHQRRTPVATIQGLVKALETGMESGRLNTQQMHAIFRAIDEQVALFYDVDTSEIRIPADADVTAQRRR